MAVELNIAINDEDAQRMLGVLRGIVNDPSEIGVFAAKTTYQFLFDHTAEVEWKGDNYIAGDLSGQWLENVQEHWQQPIAVDGAIAIINDDPTFRHKVTGGTISAKNVKYLTIPLVSESKGYRAAEYEAKTGNKLFPVKGVLAVKDPSNEAAFIPIYALKQSVNQPAWPSALPEVGDIAANFTGAFQAAISAAIRGES